MSVPIGIVHSKVYIARRTTDGYESSDKAHLAQNRIPMRLRGWVKKHVVRGDIMMYFRCIRPVSFLRLTSQDRSR